MTAHQKKAWPMRHQLSDTFLNSSLSDQSAGKALMTSSGEGTENLLTKFQWVKAAHIATTTTHAAVARASLAGRDNSFRICQRWVMHLLLAASV
jgi:hypothetical protein